MAITAAQRAEIDRKQAEYQRLSVNPEAGMHVYRAEHAHEGGDVGIHWTTDPNVAHYTNLAGGREAVVHHAIIDNPQKQIVPRGSLQRLHHIDKKTGEIAWSGRGGAVPDALGRKPRDSRDWGFDRESEVRVRPGAVLRPVGISPIGTYGKEGMEQPHPHSGGIMVAHRGDAFYLGLGRQSVPGTAEAKRHRAAELAIPRRHQLKRDIVSRSDTGEVLGNVPKWRTVGIDKSWQQVEDLAAKHGLDYTGIKMRGTYVANPPPPRKYNYSQPFNYPETKAKGSFQVRNKVRSQSSRV